MLNSHKTFSILVLKNVKNTIALPNRFKSSAKVTLFYKF